MMDDEHDEELLHVLWALRNYLVDWLEAFETDYENGNAEMWKGWQVWEKRACVRDAVGDYEGAPNSLRKRYRTAIKAANLFLVDMDGDEQLQDALRGDDDGEQVDGG